MELVYSKEKTLFTILAILAGIFWLALLVGTVGFVLLWLLMGYVAYLFVQSGFISYIRGTGVRITPEQLPELYENFAYCCDKLNIDTRPELYLLNSNGILNALATKFMGRKYVVLYSSVVDALASKPQAIRFYIGHELGHIKRGHLRWHPILMPVAWLPLLGAAYSRACEYSCDLHGAACCSSKEEAVFAIGVLAAGDNMWKRMNYNQYIAQSNETGGFWMSFHELISNYPWLTKRAKHVISAMTGSPYKRPTRNPFAWLFAFFVPNGGAGGMGGILVVAVIIGVLAAVALPAYKDYQQRALLMHSQSSSSQSDDPFSLDEMR